MAFKETVPCGHGFNIAACAECLTVSGKENCINIIPISDILQRCCPQADHFLAETVKMLRPVHRNAGQMVFYFIN